MNRPATERRLLQLIVPAGNLPCLRVAVDSGADGVYLGFRDATNARNFPGLNFDRATLQEGLEYAHRQGVAVLAALNTYPAGDQWRQWYAALDAAAELGVDAVILADLGLMAYAARTYPQLPLHLSVQGSATTYEAINFCHEHFGIRRAVLPRVLALAQIEQVIRNTPVEIEVFGFGGLCVMVEGRCSLSAYVTGESPTTHGACSPARAVRWMHTPNGLETRLNGVLVDRFGETEAAGYPTLCKGRFDVEGDIYYAIEEPASLNVLGLLPELFRLGVAAVKIEGRQRSAAYVEQVPRVWRRAIDACRNDPHRFHVEAGWTTALGQLAEGHQHTFGAYHRSWK